MLKEDVFSRTRQQLLKKYNSDEFVSYRNDVEEMDQLMDEIEPKFDELDKIKLKTYAIGMYGGIIPAGSCRGPCPQGICNGYSPLRWRGVAIETPQILIHIVIQGPLCTDIR